MTRLLVLLAEGHRHEPPGRRITINTGSPCPVASRRNTGQVPVNYKHGGHGGSGPSDARGVRRVRPPRSTQPDGAENAAVQLRTGNRAGRKNQGPRCDPLSYVQLTHAGGFTAVNNGLKSRRVAGRSVSCL